MKNINKISYEACTGCNACKQICPKQCISHKKNDGFLYPIADENVCIDCGKCLKVCPAFESLPMRKPLQCFAGYNTNDEVRLRSSSGGIFMELARFVIAQNGIVFGAVFNDDWNVVHKSASTLEEVAPMMGSKYVQSDTKNTFCECREYLKAGKYVLYSGTPCQIEGLHKFLGKDFDNLVTMDFVCHGVPSPGIWQQYLGEQFGKVHTFKDLQGSKVGADSSLNTKYSIGDIKFRDKTEGWENFRFVVYAKASNKKKVLESSFFGRNPYMRGFLNDLYLRESCFNCPAKSFSSQSDFTIGDFWGVHKLKMDDINDYKGLSLIIINTNKGKTLFNTISKKIVLRELTFEQAIISNPNLVNRNIRNDEKIAVFKSNFSNMPLVMAIKKTLHVSFKERLILKIKNKFGL